MAETGETMIDLRNLAPPEPLERALDALLSLGNGRLRLRFSMEPLPLYGLLDRQGFGYLMDATGEGIELVIWRNEQHDDKP